MGNQRVGGEREPCDDWREPCDDWWWSWNHKITGSNSVACDIKHGVRIESVHRLEFVHRHSTRPPDDASRTRAMMSYVLQSVTPVVRQTTIDPRCLKHGVGIIVIPHFFRKMHAFPCRTMRQLKVATVDDDRNPPGKKVCRCAPSKWWFFAATCVGTKCIRCGVDVCSSKCGK